MQLVRILLVLIPLWLWVTSLSAQLVFNKTEYDFGTLASQKGYFEHDFIFRNTGDLKTKILSVKSVDPALSFIYTRSAVLEGEYGFVKVKIHTDSLDGLFHDQVYITLQYGNDVQSEVLYLRAKIADDGIKEDDREFKDGRISTSVEVSPGDIETMEGFMGEDQLTQAHSEIEYLKKQVAMKSDLIAKLSDDLFKKQEQERENFDRLAALEKTLKTGGNSNNTNALNQLDDLTDRLIDMRSSDSLLRAEISAQETEYARLKQEADSARNYAQNLSQQLQEKFKSEAEAMERAQKLEIDLKQKELTEQQQQARIDSLNRVLTLSNDDQAVLKEIRKLEQEINIRKKEQALQTTHAREQNARISTLKRENAYFKESADSLANIAASSSDENEALSRRLDESNQRISSYKSMIDSLQVKASDIGNAERASIEELDSLKQALAAVNERDASLRNEISSREKELEQLQSERDLAQKNMNALERATTKQQEQAHELMYRLNGLAKKESEAQLEINDLKHALKESEYREDSTRQSVNQLVAQISNKESSIKALSNQINQKEAALSKLEKEQAQTNAELKQAQSQLSSSDARIDSLMALVNTKKDGASMLENDIAHLQKQVLTSHQKQADYQARSKELEARLDNAHLSNDLTFQELKGDINAMRNERDEYKDLYKNAGKRIAELESELVESKRSEESAIAFANELQDQGGQTNTVSNQKQSLDIVYAVNIHTSDEAVNMGATFKGINGVKEYKENGRYRYAVGSASSFKEALKEKEKLKSKGYDLAFVVAFKDGSRISLKDALETAQR